MIKHPPYLSIAILSASAMSYEILLMRLFSIIQWHHFAYMVIALALLGYGISGSLLHLLQTRVVRYYQWIYPASILLFALTSLGAFLLAQSLTFNIEELFWDYQQIINLVLIFLLLALPFMFTASAICMTFMVCPGKKAATVYAVDLLGAGIGAIAIIIVMYLLMPEKILTAISLAGVCAVAVAIWELKLPFKRPLLVTLVLVTTILIGSSPYISLTYSPYKGLMQTLQIQGTHIIDQRATPLGHLTLVASDKIPLRHAPGLSLTNTSEPLNQLGLFTDADNLTAITQYPESVKSLHYLDHTTSALAYHLLKPVKLLVIGSGTGSDLLQAQYHQVQSIDALELNPQVIELLNNDYKIFAGDVYHNPQTEVHITEARDFLSNSHNMYDMIQIAQIDSANASSSGLYALNESYLYTLEALQLYLSRLSPNGYLSITRWIKLPPRDTLKLFATAHQALESLHLVNVDKRMVLIRNWQTSTLLIKNGSFSEQELDLVEQFCNTRLFDQAYTHRLTEDQSNRHNLLSEPFFYQASKRIIANQTDALVDEYKFNLRPATDDRPYFHHFFKWSSFFEAIKLRGKGGMPLIEWGYIILVLTLGVTAILSALFILLPLSFTAHRTESSDFSVSQWHVLLYFFAIGVAFLFIEIATIQKFLLFLHHPIYAISITLCAFLVFAGLGSQSSEWLANSYTHRRIVILATTTIAFLSVSYLYLLDPLFIELAHLAMAMKMLISILLIAPLAFFMGMPFPLAISSLKQQAPNLIPWAWGINGYASVISAGMATLIAIHFGFTVVILSAVVTLCQYHGCIPTQYSIKAASHNSNIVPYPLSNSVN